MNPYKIGPYSESDTQIFKGRASEIRSMYQSFLQNDYLVCYANSGEGKSSILNAGLFPELRRQNYFPINIRFKFDESDTQGDFDAIINKAIDDSLTKQVKNLSSLKESILCDIDEDFDKEWQVQLIKKHVWLRLRYSIFKREDGTDVVPVLVFDQFEEVFTNPKSEIWTKEFFRWLEELSTDVCPDKILEAIKKKVGDELPLMSSSKKFKAIFSLRSEYVGQVDYWGLQHFYIPDLKNNRFFLKPLTPESAREVILQQDGLSYISKEECDNIISGCCGNSDYVKANLPCIPASVLSIVCRELFNLDDAKRKDILNALNKDKNSTIDEILERYYERILSECGIKNDKLRDAFENALVDDKGNRKRIGVNHVDFKTFSSDQIEKLINKNLLRVVSQSNNNDGCIVELPHDRFCKFILNHKNKRFEEIQSKNNRLKESLIFVLLSGLFCLTGLFLHNALYDVIGPWVNHDSSQDIMQGLFQFLLFNNTIPELSIKLYIVAFSLIPPLLVLPFAVLNFARQSKKSATVFSVIGILISGWLLIRSSGRFVIYARALTLLSLVVSGFILIYCIRNWNKLTKVKLSAWPLWGGYYLFCCYLFYEFIRCLAIGINEPIESSVFILILPSILLVWTILYHNINIFHKKNKNWVLAELLLFIALLAALSYNNFLEYTSPMKFGVPIVLIIIILISVLIARLLKVIEPLHRRLFVTFINITAFLSVFVLNLGYNPLCLHYSKKDITHVFNWRTVKIKDPTSNLFGLLNPINGDTIIPCVCSYTNTNSSYIIIRSEYFSNNPILSGDTINLDSSFKWANSQVEARLVCNAPLEEAITTLSKTTLSKNDEASINFYSAKVFTSLREKCINYVTKGQTFTIYDIDYINQLTSKYKSLLENELTKLSSCNIDKVEEKDICSFHSILAKSMFIFVLRNAIQKEDFTNVFCLTNTFPNILCILPTTYNFSLTANINTDTNSRTINIQSSALNEGILYAWNDLLSYLFYTDRFENFEFTSKTYQKLTVPTLEMRDNLKRSISLLTNGIDVQKIEGIYDRMASDDSLSREDLVEYIKTIGTINKNMGIPELSSLLNKLRTIHEKQSKVLQTNTLQDPRFTEYANNIFEAITPILKNNNHNVYYNVFASLYRNLLQSCILRDVPITERLDTLMQIDSTNHLTLKLIDKYHKQRKQIDSLIIQNGKEVELIYGLHAKL